MAECLGCKRFVVEGEIIERQGLTLELCPFDYPLELGILKSWQKEINSMVNTCGGAIYLTNSEKVQGIALSSKQQGIIRQAVADLVSPFHPGTHELARVLFLPVLSESLLFTGRYLPKIVVQQGSTDQLYTFEEQVIIEDAQQKVVYKLLKAFERTPVGLFEFNPTELKMEIIARQREKPARRVMLHEGCNPRPLDLSPDTPHIEFYFHQGGISQALASVLNQAIIVAGIMAQGEWAGDRFFRVFFGNSVDLKVGLSLVEREVEKAFELFQRKNQAFHSTTFDVFDQRASNQQIGVDRESDKPEQKTVTGQQPPKEKPRQSFKTFYFMISNIKKQCKDDFSYYLEQKSPKSGKQFFANSVLLDFGNQAELNHFRGYVQKNRRMLSDYCFNGVVICGIPTGKIIIKNLSLEFVRTLQKGLQDKVYYTVAIIVEADCCLIDDQVPRSLELFDYLLALDEQKRTYAVRGSKLKFIIDTK